MATRNAIAREWADELRDGIAWVIIWKTGRSWNAQAVWLNSDDDTFAPEDLELARGILEKDPKAVMVNGYYCGHFGEDMTVAELADGIRWHYENGCNTLESSAAFLSEPMERPAGLPASFLWYGKATGAEPDPYVYDGYMSPEDYKLMSERFIVPQMRGNAGAMETDAMHRPDEKGMQKSAPDDQGEREEGQKQGFFARRRAKRR